jgi:hypothetical protein
MSCRQFAYWLEQLRAALVAVLSPLAARDVAEERGSDDDCHKGV